MATSSVAEYAYGAELRFGAMVSQIASSTLFSICLDRKARCSFSWSHLDRERRLWIPQVQVHHTVTPDRRTVAECDLRTLNRTSSQRSELNPPRSPASTSHPGCTNGPVRGQYWLCECCNGKIFQISESRWRLDSAPHKTSCHISLERTRPNREASLPFISTLYCYARYVARCRSDFLRPISRTFSPAKQSNWKAALLSRRSHQLSSAEWAGGTWKDQFVDPSAQYFSNIQSYDSYSSCDSVSDPGSFFFDYTRYLNTDESRDRSRGFENRLKAGACLYSAPLATFHVAVLNEWIHAGMIAGCRGWLLLRC